MCRTDGSSVRAFRYCLVIVALCVLACIAGADSPPLLPSEFYGSVTIGGAPAPEGTLITASIGPEVRGSFITTSAGSYGGSETFDPRLIVRGISGENGQTITFSVNGIPAAETAIYHPGIVFRQNLTAEPAGPSLVANFTVNGTAGNVPLTVQFTDISDGDPILWSWSFGDGIVSTLRDPEHTYTAPGTFSVSLTVANAGGPSGLTKPGLITVYPKGDFNWNNRVDISDVTRVAYITAGLLQPEDMNADFDSSGHVEVGDVARIAWYYVGKIPAL